MRNEPQWVDGPPVPVRCLHLQGTSSEAVFRLNWRAFGRGNDPKAVVDRRVFEAAVYALVTGQETEGTAVLESLGYQVTRVERIAER